MFFCFTAAWKEAIVFWFLMRLCSGARCTFINLWRSKVFHKLSAMKSIWHTCILSGHWPIPKFSHTERSDGHPEGFLTTDVRHAHVSAGRLPSIARLLSLLRMSSLRQTLGGAGLQGGSLNFTRLWSCKQKKPVASLPGLYTSQMVHNCCYIPFLFQRQKCINKHIY